MRLNPYSIIIGGGIGVMALLALRNPIFALFATIISIVLLDMGFKAAERRKIEKRKK